MKYDEILNLDRSGWATGQLPSHGAALDMQEVSLSLPHQISVIDYTNKLPHLVDTVPSPLLGVGAALLSKASHNVDETPVVLEPLARPSGGLLRLLLRGNLGRLTANLTRACEGAVHLTCKMEGENGV